MRICAKSMIPHASTVEKFDRSVTKEKSTLPFFHMFCANKSPDKKIVGGAEAEGRRLWIPSVHIVAASLD